MTPVTDEELARNPELRGVRDGLQAQLDAAQAKCVEARRAIRASEPLNIIVPDGLSDDAWTGLRASLDDVCREVWGQPLEWTRREGSAGDAVQWEGRSPNFQPPIPPLCMSCGRAVSPMATDTRWMSPGKAGSQYKATGWEHKCSVDCPQAGYFSMDDPNPYPEGSAEWLAYESGRQYNWEIQSRKAAVARAKLDLAAARRAELCHGHFFECTAADTEPSCRLCGLARAAYDRVPPVSRWRCAGECVLLRDDDTP